MNTRSMGRLSTALFAVFVGVVSLILPASVTLASDLLTEPPASSSSLSDNITAGNTLAPAAPAEFLLGLYNFIGGNKDEAYPLLEAGFTALSQTGLAYPGVVGEGALILGQLRGVRGNAAGAIEAYNVALEIFRRNGSSDREGIALVYIGASYTDLGRYEAALQSYLQALPLLQAAKDQANQGMALMSIGVVYNQQGRYREALQAYERALGILRELGDRSGEAAVRDRIGLVYLNQARYVEAVETLQQALTIQLKAGDSAGEALTRHRIGVAYFYQGRCREALESLHQALVITRQERDRRLEGEVLLSIGDVYNFQGLYAKALEFFDQSLAIFQGLGSQDLKAKTLTSIGLAYGNQGRIQEEIETHRRVLATYREIGRRAGEARALDNIGVAYMNQGRYGEALETFQQALTIAREVGDRAAEMASLGSKGWVYEKQGKLEEARDTLDRALAIAREAGDRWNEAGTLQVIGRVTWKQGNLDAAAETLQKAIAIATEIGDRERAGKTLADIGMVHDAQGRYTEALAALQEALAMQRQMGNTISEAAILSGTGLVYLHQGRYEAALESLGKALAIQREVGNRDDEGEALCRMGMVYQSRGETDRALAHYKQAMEVLEEVRAGAGSESGRAGFIARYSELYTRAVALYHRQGLDIEAFLTSERGRSRAFLDSLISGHVTLRDDESTALLDRERDAYRARQMAQDALARARALVLPDPVLVASLEAQLDKTAVNYRASQNAIEARSQQLAGLVSARATTFDLQRVQSLLDDQTTLVSYYVLGEEGTLAFIITHDGMKVIELPDATEQNITKQVSDLESSLTDDRASAHPTRLQDLRNMLIKPLEAYLRTPLVGIIPHQKLHYVPFAALSDGKRYLGENYILFALPSASSLLFIQGSTGKAGTGALVFGNPATDEPGLPPLPHAASEAGSVAGLLGTRSYIGAEASEARLRSGVVGVRDLHLAAHNVYNQANPLYSTIYLTPGKLSGEPDIGEAGDGRLEVREVYGLDLSTISLTVLSACETNAGVLSSGDDIVGLTRTFHFAGSPTVVSTLWPVSDAATEALMVAFYRNVASGSGYAEALQAAQAEVRSNPRWRSPFYWSGFILSGDPGHVAVPEPGKRILGAFVVAGSALGLLLAGFLVRRHRNSSRRKLDITRV